ncbi:MAG: FAD-dependent oxidoreductase [Coriobacteriaceae bacterium]|jgi:NAD(P)H-nitrite reductase large subunit|nr:FAD-dependent oxidoreductase [Coriobacteriaceae bacterium]
MAGNQAITSFDYLIIGNSAAGVTAAEYIRAQDGEGSILIVSREPYAVYGRPLISYLLEGKTTEDRMGFKPDDFYMARNIDTLFGPQYEVVSLNAAGHQAVMRDGQAIGYGKCLIATGSVPFVPPIEGLEGRTNVFGFLTLDDAKSAWNAAREATAAAHEAGRKSRAVVIGAGLIGLKAAEAISYHVDEVVVLELAPRILPAVLDDRGAAILQGQLAGHGLDCRPGITASALQGEGAQVSSVALTDGSTLECDLVIAAVGVRPDTALAVGAGAEQGRGLVVGTDLKTTLADVYAAGDVTQVVNLLDCSKQPLALWPNAMRQGKVAGQYMAGSPDAEPFEGSFAVNAVDFYDCSLLTSGIINPAPEGGYEEQVFVQGKAYAKFVTKNGLLMGYILLNRPANAGIYTTIIEERIPLAELADDLFEETPINLDFPDDLRWKRLHAFYPSGLDKRGWKE